MEYKKQVINELSQAIINAGYRVFIAESGTYGFFTDNEGTKVISFQYDLGSVSFSGNYKTDNGRQTGTGWRISEQIDLTKSGIDSLFNTIPPRWAVGNSNWKFTTLDQHLNTYQRSSRYSEVKGNE